MGLKTSPVSALQVEICEMPLQLRRKQLTAQYWVNLQGHSEDHHPTAKGFLPCWESGKAKQECFVWRCKRLVDDMLSTTTGNTAMFVPFYFGRFLYSGGNEGI